MRNYPVLAYLSLFSPLIPIIVSLSRFRMLGTELRLLLSLLIIGLFIDSSLKWFYINSQVTAFGMNLFVLVEFTLVMLIILRWQHNVRVKQFIQVVMFAYIVLWVTAKISFEPWTSPYYYTGSIANVLITLSSGAALMLFEFDNKQPLIRSPKFWVLLAFVLYYAGTLLPIMFQGVLFKRSLYSLQLVWSINWFLSVTANILFAKGVLCVSRRTIPFEVNRPQ
jgi:hypothetical protein